MKRLVFTVSMTFVLMACDSPDGGRQPSSAAQGQAQAQAQNAPAASPAPLAAVRAAVGEPAPDFTLTDLDGRPVSLRDFGGKTVVLEWFNPDCPYVKFARSPQGPMKRMEARARQLGAAWVSINSSGVGLQGHGLERNKQAVAEYGLTHPIVLDEDGKVGRLYGAKTTPHVFVIDGKGVLRYAGAIDNAPRGQVEGGAPVSYLEAALEAVASGKDPQPSESRPYGCTVKYQTRG